MNWIEGLFQINPDNGSGAMEVMIAVAVGLLVVRPGLRWYNSRKNHR